MRYSYEDLEGTLLSGKYRLVRLIGRGGMGVVYEGLNIIINKRVAVKIMSDQVSRDPELLERLHREAMAAGSVASMDVCEVFDLVVDEEKNLLFIVMELLEGKVLSAIIKEQGRLPLAPAIDMTMQILDALDAIHKVGVIHRDLKPENLFLSKEKNKDAYRVKIMDFGISKFRYEGLRTLTDTGQKMGTPYYMSPEQILESKSLDHRTDIYSMGVVLFEILTGSLPFKARNIDAIFFQILNQPFPRITSIIQDCPLKIEEVIIKATAKDPRSRYSSAREMKKALLAAGVTAGREKIAMPGTFIHVDQETATETTITKAFPDAKSKSHKLSQELKLKIIIAAWAVLFTLGVCAAYFLIRGHMFWNPSDYKLCREKDTRAFLDSARKLLESGKTTEAIEFLAIARLRESRNRKAEQMFDEALSGFFPGMKEFKEDLQKRCKKGDNLHCFTLSLIEKKNDPDHARAYLEERCEKKDFAACGELGTIYQRGAWGIATDERKAGSLYKVACNGKHMRSCTDLAWCYQFGKCGITKDEKRAGKYFKIGCDGGDSYGCTHLGWCCQNANCGLGRDEKRAAKLYDKGCSGGDMWGCSSFGLCHFHGNCGLEKDEKRAGELFNKACDGKDALGCGYLGYCLLEGRCGLTKNDKRAVELFNIGCSSGVSNSCYYLAWCYRWGKCGLIKDEKKMIEFYTKACNMGYGLSCSELGTCYYVGDCGLSKDEKKAGELYTKACDSGDMEGCRHLAICYRWGWCGVSMDTKRSVELNRIACDGGNMESCSSFGDWYCFGGEGIVKDEKLGFELLKIACDGGYIAGCIYLGDYYEHGKCGLKKDKALAGELYKKACDGGNSWGCTQFKRISTQFKRTSKVKKNNVETKHSTPLYKLWMRGMQGHKK